MIASINYDKGSAPNVPCVSMPVPRGRQTDPNKPCKWRVNKSWELKPFAILLKLLTVSSQYISKKEALGERKCLPMPGLRSVKEFNQV